MNEIGRGAPTVAADANRGPTELLLGRAVLAKRPARVAAPEEGHLVGVRATDGRRMHASLAAHQERVPFSQFVKLGRQGSVLNQLKKELDFALERA